MSVSPLRLPAFTTFLLPFLTFNFLLFTCSYADYADGDGSAEFPFEIAEPNQLIYMSEHPEDWDKHFILTADINLALADPNTFTTALIAPDTDNSNPELLEFNGTPYTGSFDGNGHTISNLTIVSFEMDNLFLGLFGTIKDPNAKIINLALEKVSIIGGYESAYLSGLCGYNDHGRISGCYVTGAVVGGDNSLLLGGLCGANSGSISNCYTTDSVNGGAYLGGLCGANSGSISNSYTIGETVGFGYVGSLCGGNGGNINNCVIPPDL